MAYRPLKTTDFSDQLALWAEAEPQRGEAIASPPPPSRPESGRQPRDASCPPAPSAVPRPAAARRTDSVSRSERALAAIRAMLSTANSGTEAAR
jgi:hypothetical protein